MTQAPNLAHVYDSKVAEWAVLFGSMAGVLMDKLYTSSGRLEGCPGERAIDGVVRPSTGQAAAFACGGSGGDMGAGGGGVAAAAQGFLEGQLRAMWPGRSQPMQCTWPEQWRTKWRGERQRKQRPLKWRRPWGSGRLESLCRRPGCCPPEEEGVNLRHHRLGLTSCHSPSWTWQVRLDVSRRRGGAMIKERSRGAAPQVTPLRETWGRATSTARTGRSLALMAGGGGRNSEDKAGARAIEARAEAQGDEAVGAVGSGVVAVNAAGAVV
jgi:hypothetical protein